MRAAKIIRDLVEYRRLCDLYYLESSIVSISKSDFKALNEHIGSFWGPQHRVAGFLLKVVEDESITEAAKRVNEADVPRDNRILK